MHFLTDNNIYEKQIKKNHVNVMKLSPKKACQPKLTSLYNHYTEFKTIPILSRSSYRTRPGFQS